MNHISTALAIHSYGAVSIILGNAMNPENTDKLLTTYPLLYRELRERCFERCDGWFDLVWQVSAEIESAARLEGIPRIAEAWPSVCIYPSKKLPATGAVR